ncbi:MAG TPA: type II toxin-antitoxin system RelE/ParE family toxin [Gemmataceae bacterium]|jgi:plasmid stabilization system protein ParE
MANVIYLPGASADYQAEYAYYAARSPRAAARFETLVQDAVQKILAMPQAYPAYDRRHRMFVLHGYPCYLVYRERAGDIEIVAVANSWRRPGYWKGR